MAADAATHGRADTPPPGSGPPVTYEPGGCQEGAGSIDFPPPVGVQAQAHPPVGNATAVPNLPVRFGTLGPVPPYAQPQELVASTDTGATALHLGVDRVLERNDAPYAGYVAEQG